jgi:hypothetical protein
MFVQIKRESCSSPISQCDEPTDLSTTGGREREERERERHERELEERERERQERERYYSQLMERYNIDRGSPSRCVPYLPPQLFFIIKFYFKTSLSFW